jgi:hypothetical protein
VLANEIDFAPAATVPLDDVTVKVGVLVAIDGILESIEDALDAIPLFIV